MKWHKFSDKFPVLGTNILFASEDKKIGITEFNLEMRRVIKYFITEKACDGNVDAICVDFFSDDPQEDVYQIAIENAKYWAYPSNAADDI